MPPTLAAEPARVTGTRPSRRLRATGRVPAVVYGSGVGPLSISVDGRELAAALVVAGSVQTPIELDVSGERHLVAPTEVQRHPLREQIVHVDFVVVGRPGSVRRPAPKGASRPASKR